MTSAIEKLLKHPRIWRSGSGDAAVSVTGLSTGFSMLDQQLPQGGWPTGALTEIVSHGFGIGELRLVMPALAALTRAGQWVTWVSPPYVPYAPALRQRGIDLSRIMVVKTTNETEHLWVSEQILRDESSGAVLLWSYPRDGRKLRRLQLAAERGKAWGILFSDPSRGNQNTPVSLRLKVAASVKGLQIDILKCRGSQSNRTIHLPQYCTRPIPVEGDFEDRSNG